MLAEEELKTIGEIIDRLMSVPVASGSSQASRPVLIELYEAARAKFGDPLTYLAAKWFSDNLKPGDRVLIVTGFIVPPWLRPENDGPVGAVNLARALNLAFDVRPTIVTEAMMLDMMKPLCEAGGLAVADEWAASQLYRRVSLESFTTDSAKADAQAEEMLDRIKPKVIVTIEKASPNSLGVFHSGVGYDITSMHAKVDVLIRKARERGVYTIGIGDGGNEIGMGCVEEAVKKAVPTGAKCGCPCGGGTASGVETDLLLAVMVSNWGATAIAANLAARLGYMEVLHDREMEGKLLEAAASAGFIDPASGLGIHDGDAIDKEVHLAMVDIMNFIVRIRMTPTFYLQKYRWYVAEKRDEIQDMIARWDEFVSE
jgi:D-glutamate cyclase